MMGHNPNVKKNWSLDSRLKMMMDGRQPNNHGEGGESAQL
jgi:hypothetical protein